MATRRNASPLDVNGSHHENGTAVIGLEPHSPIIDLATLPPHELNGIEEFGPQRNWINFDAQRGILVCPNLGAEYEEFSAVILESRVVFVMKDEDGNVFCASSDRTAADKGRPGRICESCEDRNVNCFPRWWIAWQELGTELIFAHTLSQTGSANFLRYANMLMRVGVTPSQIISRIFVEEAFRQKTQTMYRRLQFEQLEA